MGRIFNTVATLTASAVSRSNRKKTLKNIERINKANRNLVYTGRVTVDQVIPCYYQIGNICVSGGEQETRNKLVVQSVLQSASVGLPTVVLHEGNHHLESDLARVCSSQPYFRIINGNNPFYDPILRLNDDETAMMIVAASNQNNKIDAAGALYLRALTALLRSRGVTPYLRMIASCPHNSIQSVIIHEEQAGHLTPNDATAIRNDINAGMASRANIEYFFSQLQAETDIVAWKSHLSNFNPRSPHGERLRKVTILSIRIIGFAQKVYHKTVLLRISLAENAVILPEKPRNPVRTSLQKAGGLRFARAIRAARPYSISSPSGA